MANPTIARAAALATILVVAACSSSSDGDAVGAGAGGAGGAAPVGGAPGNGGATATGGGVATASGGGGTTSAGGGGGAGAGGTISAGGSAGSGGSVDASLVDVAAEAAPVEAAAPRDVSVDSTLPSTYRGAPYSDTQVTGGAQKVPGRIQAEYYDVVSGTNPLKGQEGVTIHDTDPANNGTAEASDAGTDYLNRFRMGEAVDICYTKTAWDDTIYNFAPQQPLQLYVGWINKGEWLKYTVEVAQAAVYAIDVMYTCNGGGTMQIVLDDDPALTTGPIALTNTAPGNNGQAPADHAWHIWNKLVAGGTIALPAGKHLLKVQFDAVGLGVNLDWIDLRLL
jgi:hypothetical protein